MTNDDLLLNSNEDTKTMETPSNGTDELVRRHIRILVEGERIDMDKWLFTLNKFYNDGNYSPLQRIAYTITFLNEEQKTWYEQHKDEIKEDWTLFCEQLTQYMSDWQAKRIKALPTDNLVLKHNEVNSLEELIDTKFNKYSGNGDAKAWLLQTMNQFKKCGLRRSEQFQAISFLLEDEAYLWYVQHTDMISNFDTFSNLFLQQYAPTPSMLQDDSLVGTVSSSSIVPDNLSTSHLQRTVADEIIKKPTYFRGSKDDVYDWLEKLEQRFHMAQWSDGNKLHYISIHLQDDAYRWWMQTSTTIKTWSSFIDAVTRAFGSTRTRELAFEQLKWYKQTVNQSITQYYDKIIELCKKVDPVMPDSLKVKYLMAGIKESLKTHVALQDPQTTEAFLSSARKIEDVLSLTNTNNELLGNDTTINAANYQNQPTNQTTFKRTSNNAFNQNPRYANATRDRTTYNQNTSTGDNANRQNRSSKYTRSMQRSNACFNCGTLGHYARDCTRPHFQ